MRRMSLDEMRRELREKFERLKSAAWAKQTSNPNLVDFEGKKIVEVVDEIERTITRMTCEELYRTVDEARMLRDATRNPTLLFVLTGIIHRGSILLKEKCPIYWTMITTKYKLKEL